MNKEESWLAFKNKHPRMLESALGPQVSRVFETIKKSGILNRFGANPMAAENFEALIQRFTKQAHDAGWTNKENQELTTEVKQETEVKQQ